MKIFFMSVSNVVITMFLRLRTTLRFTYHGASCLVSNHLRKSISSDFHTRLGLLIVFVIIYSPLLLDRRNERKTTILAFGGTDGSTIQDHISIAKTMEKIEAASDNGIILYKHLFNANSFLFGESINLNRRTTAVITAGFAPYMMDVGNLFLAHLRFALLGLVGLCTSVPRRPRLPGLRSFGSGLA